MKSLEALSIYEIYIRSFADSNGDGIGDFQGIIQKLGYIHALGVNMIWITPFYLSPQVDNGYDIENYYQIDPQYGTMSDFEELVQKADKLGMGIMIDLVLNHTSDQHEWFQKALNGEKKYQDFYYFRKGKAAGTPPTNWESKFGGSAWEYVPKLGLYYLHLYSAHQADLNWNNPLVREQLFDIIRFWLQKGVSGLRFDVLNVVSKSDDFQDDEAGGDGRKYYTDGPHIHAFIREMNEKTFGRFTNKKIFTVGEMSSTSIENAILYTNPSRHELDLIFQFYHLRTDYAEDKKWTNAKPDYDVLKETLNSWQEGMQNGNGNIALFWSNHDQPRVVSRFGSDGEYSEKSAKMLAMLLYFMRGTPCIYQGEELGMKNAEFQSIAEYRDIESIKQYAILKKEGKPKAEILSILNQKSRDNSRTPMQWNSSADRGFAIAPWIPFSKSAAENVQDEQQQSDSVLNFYRKLLHLRKQEPLLTNGLYQYLNTNSKALYCYLRVVGKQVLLVACNLSAFTCVQNFSQVSELRGLVPKAVLLTNEKMVEWENIHSTPYVFRPFEALALIFEKD